MLLGVDRYTCMLKKLVDMGANLEMREIKYIF